MKQRQIKKLQKRIARTRREARDELKVHLTHLHEMKHELETIVHQFERALHALGRDDDEPVD